MIKPYLLEFNCPLCGSNHAKHVCVSRPNRESYKTEFYECAGCRVMFRDLGRFTKLIRSVYNTELKRIKIKEVRSDYP